VGGVGLVMATGFYGGKLVFEHAAGIPSPVLEAELHERTEGHHHHDEAAEPVDSSGTPPATHTHAPGTPPHQD